MPTAAIQNGRPAADCPPAPVRVTKSLLGYGVLAGPFYVAASLAEALTRPGFSLAHNDWSLLANGALGWIHVLVLVLTGLMVGAAAAGVVRQRRAERVNAASGWFLGVYAAGLVGAGFFIADPADGFPVGTPPGPTVTPSWHGTLHIVFGGIGFLGLITACLVLAWQFRGLRQLGWAFFSLITGVLFFTAFAGIATGGAASSLGVLAFTGAVILAWTWLALVSAHLYHRPRSGAWVATRVAACRTATEPGGSASVSQVEGWTRCVSSLCREERHQSSARCSHAGVFG